MDDLHGGFEYEPLDTEVPTIRLLTLLPGTGHYGVDCILEHYPLDNAPPYSAFSCMWGSLDHYKETKVNGRWLRIRENLCRFLAQLQKPGEARLL